MTYKCGPLKSRQLGIERLIGQSPSAMWWAKALAGFAWILVSNLIQ
jgi:hypothetical protein